MNLALRDASENDLGFAFSAKRDALGPYVAARWGWDDDVQLKHHEERWHAKPWQVVLLGTEPIGTVSIDWQPSHMQFGEFYLLESFRRRGIGAQLLMHALTEADRRRCETRLEHLKWNPVGTLYQRHGFERIDENDTHFFLVRAPRVA